MDPSPEMLREQFYAILDAPEDARAPRWHKVWSSFVSDPWFQAELEKLLGRVLYHRGAPAPWLDDLRQDAIMFFARDLRRRVDLGVNRARAAEHFPGWLATILWRICKQALRARCRAQHRNGANLGARREIVAPNSLRAMEIDMAIEELPEPMRTILAMRRLGWRISEIGKKLKMTPSQIDEAPCDAIERLSR